MARRDEEGSGGYHDDIEDDDYAVAGSGDGSGDGNFALNTLLKFIFINSKNLFSGPTSQLPVDRSNDSSISSTGASGSMSQTRISHRILLLPSITVVLLSIRLYF